MKMNWLAFFITCVLALGVGGGSQTAAGNEPIPPDAPRVLGIVEQVYEPSAERKAITVNVDPSTQEIVSDITIVSVLSNMIFKDNQPGAAVSVGDTVEFYVDGWIQASYPSGCNAFQMNILSTAPTENGNPYFVLFSQLFEDDPGLNGGINQIAVDLTNVMAEDNTEFLALMNAFCEKEGYTLLEDSVEGLIEKGVIKDLYFEDGIVVSFTDVKLTDTKLITEASKWRSGLGAIGGTYTLENQNGVWSVTDVGMQWIS